METLMTEENKNCKMEVKEITFDIAKRLYNEIITENDKKYYLKKIMLLYKYLSLLGIKFNDIELASNKLKGKGILSEMFGDLKTIEN